MGGKTFAESAKLTTLEAELYRVNDIQSTDTASIRFYSDTGTCFMFVVTHACEKYTGPEICVVGEKGRIDWNNQRTRIETEKGINEIPSSTPKLREHLFEKVLKRVSNPTQFICDLDIAGTQTLCTNATYESSPIHEIDNNFWQQKNDVTSPRAIKGIDQIICNSFEKELLFSELGVDWAVAPEKTIDLTKYSKFPQSTRLQNII